MAANARKKPREARTLNNHSGAPTADIAALAPDPMSGSPKSARVTANKERDRWSLCDTTFSECHLRFRGLRRRPKLGPSVTPFLRV